MSASDKRFHAWGFGGVVVNGPEQNDEVSHAFNLNGMAEVTTIPTKIDKKETLSLYNIN